MRKGIYLKWSLVLLFLLLLLTAAILISLSTGELRISWMDLPTIIQQPSGLEYTILFKIRMPRIILGIGAGGALSLSGVLLQGIYRNPLVEPYTLGISGGAALGVALAIVAGFHLSVGAMVLPLAGFVGSILTIFLVYFLSVRRGLVNIHNMLLVGVMISFLCSSAMMLLMSTTSTENIHGIIFWIMGSLDEPDHSLIALCVLSSLVGLIVSYLFVNPLNALRLGEVKARHLGVNTMLALRILFVLASLMTGICVSVAGVIGFIGLVIPHLIRKLVGSDFRILLVCSFIGGSAFLVICDSIARSVIAPNELPIGVITGIAGALMFLFVMSGSGIKKELTK